MLWAPDAGLLRLQAAAAVFEAMPCVVGLFAPAAVCPVGQLQQTGSLQKPQGLAASVIEQMCKEHE
jgi:hypothetical protein